MSDYLPFIIFLMILAVFLRAESALTIFYMIIGTFLLGLWWNKRSIQHVKITRQYEDHVFFGENIPVRLKIENKSILPILWLEIHESLPVNLRAGRNVKQVFSLGIRGKKEIKYTLSSFKRGLYSLGPLLASSGDPLGFINPKQTQFTANPLTVYPQIINLDRIGLPSRSPFGTLKHHNPIYEDPSRIMGKREYQSGDSLKRIDWKSSASSGQFKVKLYEASIALEISILLDLHKNSYNIKSFYDDTELAVIAAASLAAWGKRHKQSIGLVTNGFDPSQENRMPKPLPPKKGASHFINILEILARIQPGDSLSIESFIHDARATLPWGTTMVLISGAVQDSILEQLFQARKTGLNPVILLTGHAGDIAQQQRLAELYHIPLHRASFPIDLETINP